MTSRVDLTSTISRNRPNSANFISMKYLSRKGNHQRNNGSNAESLKDLSTAAPNQIEEHNHPNNSTSNSVECKLECATNSPTTKHCAIPKTHDTSALDSSNCVETKV